MIGVHFACIGLHCSKVSGINERIGRRVNNSASWFYNIVGHRPGDGRIYITATTYDASISYGRFSHELTVPVRIEGNWWYTITKVALWIKGLAAFLGAGLIVAAIAGLWKRLKKRRNAVAQPGVEQISAVPDLQVPQIDVDQSVESNLTETLVGDESSPHAPTDQPLMIDAPQDKGLLSNESTNNGAPVKLPSPRTLS